MSNMKTLKNYLVEKDNAYLLDDNNNGKTIMLSGKWGSGKTHFWIEKIVKTLKEKKIPNHYISLYGKTSIEQIKYELFLKIYESIDSDELLKKTINTAKSSAGVVSSLVKSVSVFGLSVDLSKVTDPIFENVEQLQDENKLKKTEKYLNSGAIICFDDFERKSKDIDLNDLFGFISQLTIEFNCKVVIILNDDVFEGEEKKVFSNVKEKTVSKFLYFNPSIEELFEIICTSDEKYKVLDKYKDKILETIKETEELNARIYIQVLDNLVEWIESDLEDNEDIVRCLVLVNINFILYHVVFYNKQTKWGDFRNVYEVKNFFDKCQDFEYYLYNSIKKSSSFETYYENVYNRILGQKETSEEKIKEYKEFYLLNKKIYFAKFNANKLDIAKNLNEVTFQKINNFIETGILPNE